jgi:hypothetical protein
MKEYSKGYRRMVAKCEGGQGPAWAAELQMMMNLV